MHQVVEHIDAYVSVNQIRTWTRRDPVLSRVCEFVMSGSGLLGLGTGFMPTFWVRFGGKISCC